MKLISGGFLEIRLGRTSGIQVLRLWSRAWADSLSREVNYQITIFFVGYLYILYRALYGEPTKIVVMVVNGRFVGQA